MTKKRFPKTIYITRDDNDNDSDLLVADASPDGFAMLGEEIVVAVYQFVTTKVLVTKSELCDP